MSINFENHPCFSAKARGMFGRVHLPVAPRCNVQCNFCNRKFDCANESRPGVTSAVLTPYQAMVYLEQVMTQLDNISVVGIAGPGDPFANPAKTLETLRLVREKYPDVILCVATNGLNLAPYVDEVARLDVSHVTVTVNAIEPAIGAKVYAWVRHGKRVRPPQEGAEILWQNQLTAIQRLKECDVTVKVNTIIMPGINDDHIETVAAKMAELEVDVLNCMAYYPTPGSAFENLTPPSPKLIHQVRKKAGAHLSMMHHCARCRADAVGLLGQEMSPELNQKLREAKTLTTPPQKIDSNRPYIAATSMEGMLVNQHLGEAAQLFIFGRENGRIQLKETRSTPVRGGGMERWHDLADLIGDCRALLVNGIGNSPKRILAKRGVNILEVEGVIEEVAGAVFDGRSINHMLKRSRTVCGVSCSGTGGGCG